MGVEITIKLTCNTQGVHVQTHGKPNKSFNVMEKTLAENIVAMAKQYVEEAVKELEQRGEAKHIAGDIVSAGGNGDGAGASIIQLPDIIPPEPSSTEPTSTGAA